MHLLDYASFIRAAIADAIRGCQVYIDIAAVLCKRSIKLLLPQPSILGTTFCWFFIEITQYIE